MLPFPLALPPMGRPSVSPPPDPRARTLEHLRAALGVRGDGIIPAYRVGVPSAASAAAAAVPPQLSGGYRASRADLVGNSFVAERDFLVWLLLNNVTICDLGAASRTLLYKGTRSPRPSRPCPSETDVHGGSSGDSGTVLADGGGSGASSGVVAGGRFIGGALRPHVHIWHGRRDDGRLGFMCAPCMLLTFTRAHVYTCAHVHTHMHMHMCTRSRSRTRGLACAWTAWASLAHASTGTIARGWHTQVCTHRADADAGATSTWRLGDLCKCRASCQ